MEESENLSCGAVLVVEDDDAIRDVIQRVLESEGYVVRTAANGQAAMDLVHNIPRPCLVLLDLMMPVKNGWEFLDELRVDHFDMIAALPVVITSAAGSGAANPAVKNAQGFIKKPIDIDLLLRYVRTYCGPPKKL